MNTHVVKLPAAMALLVGSTEANLDTVLSVKSKIRKLIDRIDMALYDDERTVLELRILAAKPETLRSVAKKVDHSFEWVRLTENHLAKQLQFYMNFINDENSNDNYSERLQSA